ncbi:hypothetical protein [Cerasicoccus frondis]|uniref:hypothetical protein n=1 Tax=Cerasicoccus frondis TaxID=490090 RepID=UPI002852BBAA|nr:hypothetical protein [Cerasicoccus frondis]
MPPSTATEQIWMRHARLTAWGANLFWWLQRYLPLFLAWNLISAVGVIYARQQRWPQEVIVWSYIGGAVVLGLIALGLAWKRFLTQRDGLIRLEEHLGLKSALSAASEGVIAWPALPAEWGAPFHFKWGPVATPISASAILLIIGCLIPVEKISAQVEIDNPQQPMAWEELDAWIEELEENDVVEEVALEELKEKLNNLRQQPAEQWFTQSSLEAGDNLRDQTQQDLQKLAQEMLNASAMLDAMKQAGKEPFSEQAKMLNAEMAKTLQKMQLGSMPIDGELMEMLKKMGDCQACSGIDPTQYKLVKGKLDKNGKLVAMMAKLDEKNLEEMLLIAGQCQLLGMGEIQRGPGAAPLTANATESRVKPGTMEGVSNEDLRNASLGDTIAIQDRAPDENEAGETFTITTTSGAASLGEGGDVVWKNQLSPEERKLLENYFQ